jgi:hypothetical protein
MARRVALIAGLLLAVVLGHVVALQWLAWQSVQASALKQMAAPMLTRLLKPAAPPPMQAQAPPPPKPKPRRPPGVIEAPAPSVPEEVTVTVAPPEPEPTPTTVVTPAEEIAGPVQPTPSPSEPVAGTPTESPTAYLDTWPTDTRLNYRVGGYYRGQLYGSAKVEWLREEARYQTRIEIDLGLVGLVMTSQGGVSQQGLTPFAYEEVRARKRRSVLLQDKVVLDDGRQVPRPEGVQDSASQFVDLSHRFATGQVPLVIGNSDSFWMARPGGVDYWTYDIVGTDMLQLPKLGTVEAFRLKPRPIENARGNITAEFWIAPTLQYLPVRIVITQGEASLDLVVLDIEQR